MGRDRDTGGRLWETPVKTAAPPDPPPPSPAGVTESGSPLLVPQMFKGS